MHTFRYTFIHILKYIHKNMKRREGEGQVAKGRKRERTRKRGREEETARIQTMYALFGVGGY